MIVCLVLLRKFLNSKQPKQARATVCKLEANGNDLLPCKMMETKEIYDSSPEFPENETQKLIL